MRWLALSLLVSVGFAREASAEDASSRSVARQEFRRGVELANGGDLTGAVEAFEKAYRTHPHYAVLYNLGQAYVRLGKPVEAIRKFEKFLAEGGEGVDASRRREVEGLLKRERSLVGTLDLAVAPTDAEVLLDGKTVNIAVPIALVAGKYAIVARKPGYAARAETFEIRGGDTLRVSLELSKIVERTSLGLVVVTCEIPGVEVFVDGERRGKTPLPSPLVVPVGQRTVRFARVGYRAYERSVAVGEPNAASVACAMATDLKATKPARLNVAPSEPFARVSVDGERFDGRALPPGPHTVSVERAGFEPWQRTLTLEPGGSRTIAVLLEPTPEHRAELEARQRRQTWYAVGFGAAGVALLGTAVGLFAWNGERYDDWQVESPDAAATAADLQRTDDIAAGVAILGAGALVTAGVLWLTSGTLEPAAKRAAR